MMAKIGRLLRDSLELIGSKKARPLLVITLCVDGAFIFVFLVALQSYLSGASLSLPGYALAGYGVAKLGAQLLAGRLMDRAGAIRTAFIAFVVLGAGQVILLAALLGTQGAVTGAAVYGFGSALLWPSLYAYASTTFPAGERARLSSALTLTTGVAVVSGLGLGIVLPERLPFAAAEVIALAAIGLAAGAALFMEPASGGLAGPAETGERARGRQLLTLALDARRIGLAGAILLESLAVGSLQAVFRSFGRDYLGVSFRHELVLLAPAAILGASAVFLGGALSDRLGRLPLLATGFGGVAAALIAVALVTAQSGVIVLAAAGGVSAGLAMPSIGALSMDLSPASARGTILAWFMTMEGVGHAVGAAVGGFLNSYGGATAALRFAAMDFGLLGIGAAVSLGWTFLPFPSAGQQQLDSCQKQATP